MVHIIKHYRTVVLCIHRITLFSLLFLPQSAVTEVSKSHVGLHDARCVRVLLAERLLLFLGLVCSTA